MCQETKTRAVLQFHHERKSRIVKEISSPIESDAISQSH